MPLICPLSGSFLLQRNEWRSTVSYKCIITLNIGHTFYLNVENPLYLKILDFIIQKTSCRVTWGSFVILNSKIYFLNFFHCIFKDNVESELHCFKQSLSRPHTFK